MTGDIPEKPEAMKNPTEQSQRKPASSTSLGSESPGSTVHCITKQNDVGRGRTGPDGRGNEGTGARERGGGCMRQEREGEMISLTLTVVSSSLAAVGAGGARRSHLNKRQMQKAAKEIQTILVYPHQCKPVPLLLQTWEEGRRKRRRRGATARGNSGIEDGCDCVKEKEDVTEKMGALCRNLCIPLCVAGEKDQQSDALVQPPSPLFLCTCQRGFCSALFINPHPAGC